MDAQERLRDAARRGDIGAIRAALADGALLDVDPDTPVAWACDAGHAQAVAYMLDRGGRATILDYVWASKHGHEDVMAVLRDHPRGVAAAAVAKVDRMRRLLPAIHDPGEPAAGSFGADHRRGGN